MFTVDLLQAVSDWQQGGDIRIKAKRGEALKSIAKSLSIEFKSSEVPCYRKLDLDNHSVWGMGTTSILPETISSWSTSRDFCMQFNGGVVPKNQSVIFVIQPSDANIILNIKALFEDRRFIEFKENNKSLVKGYEFGTKIYGDSEQEVVIECNQLPLSSISALGGFPSNVLAEFVSTPHNGYWIIEPEVVKRIVDKLVKHANDLKNAQS